MADLEIINVRLPVELHRELKAAADDNERTVAAEVRMAIKAWVRTHRPSDWRPPDPGRLAPNSPRTRAPKLGSE